MFLKAPHFLCNVHGDLWRRWPVANDNVAKLLTFLLSLRFFFRIFMKFELRKKVGLDCIHFFLLSRDGLAGDHLQYCQQSLNFLKSWLDCKPVIHTLASGSLPPFPFFCLAIAQVASLPLLSYLCTLRHPVYLVQKIQFLFFKYWPYGL